MTSVNVRVLLKRDIFKLVLNIPIHHLVVNISLKLILYLSLFQINKIHKIFFRAQENNKDPDNAYYNHFYIPGEST